MLSEEVEQQVCVQPLGAVLLTATGKSNALARHRSYAGTGEALARLRSCAGTGEALARLRSCAGTREALARHHCKVGIGIAQTKAAQ